MKVSEAFLVNTKNFEAIIDTIVKYDAEEAVINSDLLEVLGYSDPNDLLVIRLLKDFNIINNDGKPDKYFQEFQNPETTKIALAKGLVEAHGDVFEKYPTIHQASSEKIKSAFNDIFQGKKTDLIIKYISGTFHKVVSYVGVSTIDNILKDQPVHAVAETDPSDATSGINTNGSPANGTPAKEQVGDKNIDDIVSGLDTSESNKNVEKDEQTPVFQDEEEDPFNFEESDDQPEFVEETTTDEIIDVDPVDLDIPLSSATKSTKAMTTVNGKQEFVQKALLRKSDLLHKMHRWEELVPALETIIERFDGSTESPTLSDAVSRAVIRRAMALLKLDRNDEALEALDTVINRFKDSENNEFYNQASKAMLLKANMLENSNTNLLPLYNTIIDRLDTSSGLGMKEKLDEIHVKRYDLILDEGANSEILDASTQLIERFSESEKHQTYLQKAMMKRAEILDEMGRDEEALKAYDEFLEMFG
jgi:tetratricopeptide (TPR) repeat protein